MGTLSTKKILKQVLGTVTEEAALLTSAGPADADKIPALGATGVLDPSIINAKATSTGAGDAGKVVQLDPAGRIDVTMMPTGIGADVASITASEALANGDLVNIWNDAGTAKVRKADASAPGKEAHGYVRAAVASAAQATVYFEGTNDQMTGLTAGNQFLSETTPGKTTATAPTGSGHVIQRVGFATGATAMNFQSNDPIVLA